MARRNDGKEVSDQVSKLIDALRDKKAAYLAGSLSFKMDYNSYVGGNSEEFRRILLIEGSTDELFVKKIKENNIHIQKANVALEESSRKNNKEAILHLLAFKNMMDPKNEFELFGMVDLDEDDPEDIKYVRPNIFVTDAHDLETTLFAFDEGLTSYLELEYGFSKEKWKAAVYVSYQIEQLRALLRVAINNTVGYREFEYLNVGYGRQAYASYIGNNYKVDARKYLEFYNQCLANEYKKIQDSHGADIDNPNVKELLEKVTSIDIDATLVALHKEDKKKLFDENMSLIQSYEEFVAEFFAEEGNAIDGASVNYADCREDAAEQTGNVKKKNNKKKSNKKSKKNEEQSVSPIWLKVNGHEVLTIFSYLDENAAKKYRFFEKIKQDPRDAYKDRKFENDIIKAFNYVKIEKATMFQKMLKSQVVKKVENLELEY